LVRVSRFVPFGIPVVVSAKDWRVRLEVAALLRIYVCVCPPHDASNVAAVQKLADCVGGSAEFCACGDERRCDPHAHMSGKIIARRSAEKKPPAKEL
jgi:hypothetical protein